MRPKLLSAALLVVTPALVFTLPARAEDAERVSLEPFVSPASANSFTEVVPSDPGYLAHELAKYGLFPLATQTAAAGEERFRFLWVRSFNRPALFEVCFAADGSGVYSAKLWEKTEDGGRWLVQLTKHFEADLRITHRKILGEIKFFELPFYDGRGGLDGAIWLFEAQEGERSHAVCRWSPEEGPLRALGVSLIEAAIPSEFLPIY